MVRLLSQSPRAGSSVFDPASPPLEARRLTKRFGRLVALDDVDLAIRPQSITALVGPNGAGKSTLIKAWLGYERPSAGSVRVHGLEPMRAAVSTLRAIGYVPQADALYQDFSAEDHLQLARHYRPAFQFDAALARLHELRINPKVRVRQLSGGQRAQVMLSIALHLGADILLLDEPLASLDPLARREVLHHLTTSVSGAGTTVLITSQVVTDIEQACNHLIVLGNGRVMLDESIEAALRGHTIGKPGGSEPGRVAEFLESNGERVALFRVANPGPAVVPATLEQIVLGYLSAGRSGTSR